MTLTTDLLIARAANLRPIAEIAASAGIGDVYPEPYGRFKAKVSEANLSALADNHIYWGNALGIDPRRITWRRCLDLNDRALRQTVLGLGGNGAVREDGFDILVASEVMPSSAWPRTSPTCRHASPGPVATRRDGSAITAADLDAPGAMAVLLRDALRPNRAQTLDGTPALAPVGGGGLYRCPVRRRHDHSRPAPPAGRKHHPTGRGWLYRGPSLEIGKIRSSNFLLNRRFSVTSARSQGSRAWDLFF